MHRTNLSRHPADRTVRCFHADSSGSPSSLSSSPSQPPSGGISSDKTVTIGRAEDNSVVLSRPQVSKHHLEMRQQGGTVTVRDLGSLNGTYVNGVRIREEKRVLPGDRITVDTVDLPWETWFTLPRTAPAVPPRVSGAGYFRHEAVMRGEREEVRRKVEAKLTRLKELINNK